MADSVVRKSDLSAWMADDRRFALLRGVLLVLSGALGALFPTQVVLTVAALTVVVGIWRHPDLLPLSLIAVMGNTKFNLYLGFITVFPEYLPLGVGALIMTVGWLARPESIREQRILWLFAALTFSGVLSSIFALEVRAALTRSFIVPIAGAAFWFTATGLRTRVQLTRALVVLQWGVAVGAAVGVAQMVPFPAVNEAVNLGFLRRFGNPEFEYSVGAPVLHQLTATFRANGLFNDPNIFGGYLAVMFPVLASLALGPWAQKSRARLAGIWTVLALTSVALLLSLSRSGMLAAAGGAFVLILLRPDWLRAARLWTGLAALVATAIAVAAMAGTQVLLIFTRLAESFASHDLSARAHESALIFGLKLFAQFPITGVGLSNFGAHYIRQVEPGASAMMAHNAFVGWLAETGIVGGVAMAALLVAVVKPPLRAWKQPNLRSLDPEMHALLSGFLAAFVALAVTNFFYDFWLRTFVWVIFGFAVAIARLVSSPEPRR